MKLFLVIYIAGKIGGTVGPLPTPENPSIGAAMDACMSHALEYQRQASIAVSTGKDVNGKPIPADQLERIKTLEFRCEYSAKRPKNEY